jgi:hypothetical protein
MLICRAKFQLSINRRYPVKVFLVASRPQRSINAEIEQVGNRTKMPSYPYQRSDFGTADHQRAEAWMLACFEEIFGVT